MVLVTGGTGLIGRELVRRLVEQGQRVRVLSRQRESAGAELFIGDIANPGAVEAAMKGVKTVYHLAARVDHFATAAELHRTNVLGTAHVVQAALKQGVQRLIHCSTVSAEKGGGTTAYGQSKIKAEAELRALRDRLPWVIVRPGPVYDAERHNLRKAVQFARRFRIFGRLVPDTTVHLASRTNVVNAMLLAEGKGIPGRAYAICDSRPVQRSLLSKIICERTRAVSVPIPVRVASPVLHAVSGCMEAAARMRHTRPQLNRNYLRMLARRREYDIGPAIEDLGYEPAPTEIDFAQAVDLCLSTCAYQPPGLGHSHHG